LDLTWVLQSIAIGETGSVPQILRAPKGIPSLGLEEFDGSSHRASVCNSMQAGQVSWRSPAACGKIDYLSPRADQVPAALKEKKMKRILSLSLGLLAVALVPALAQTPAPTTPAPTTAKIHGHITNPSGAPQVGGTVALSTDGGTNQKVVYTVSGSGDYAGDAPPGFYAVVYRTPETPKDKVTDMVTGVKIVAGEDVTEDFDMSRQAFIDKLPADQKKAVEELRKANAVAMSANKVINQLNADLKIVNQDLHDIDGARATVIQTLGATASADDINAKVAELQNAKYSDIETMMLKDSAAKPDESILWVQLGHAQVGLKKYDDATTSYKKALDLVTASNKTPKPEVVAQVNAGLGEIYARTGKVAEAQAAYDAAAKANPATALVNYKNEAVIFFQEKNAAAQVAAANEAIAVDPTQPILYYLKGQGLIQSATFDDKTQRIVLPPDCTLAYQTYLQLSPTGPYAAEVKGILQQAGEKVESSFKAPKPAKH
jgi:tetratricopeptide (TPR) repeat protein